MLIPATTLIKNSSSFPPPCLFRATRLFGREEQVDYLIKVVYPAKEAYRYLAELHFASPDTSTSSSNLSIFPFAWSNCHMIQMLSWYTWLAPLQLFFFKFKPYLCKLFCPFHLAESNYMIENKETLLLWSTCISCVPNHTPMWTGGEGRWKFSDNESTIKV